MKGFALKKVTWYAIIGLLIAVALLPVLRASAPQYFPDVAGFADLSCKDVSCREGQFCENKKCVNIVAPNSLGLPSGNQ